MTENGGHGHQLYRCNSGYQRAFAHTLPVPVNLCQACFSRTALWR